MTEKQTNPKQNKKITPRMITIWVISFVAVLVFGFGGAALGLGLSNKYYAQAVNLDDVLLIEYMNGTTQKEISNKRLAAHRNPMQNIVNLLNSSRKTNKLVGLFQLTDEHVAYENMQTSTFEANNQKAGLRIRFGTPRYSVIDGSDSSRYELVPRDDPRANVLQLVYEILIPLNNAQNRFQAQTWYIVTQNPMVLPQGGESITISHKLITYGNYYKLGNEIQDLRVYC